MARNLFHGVSDQAKAGKHRLDDARVLLGAARWRGAMYLAGYSVECVLKTKLMKLFNCRHLRELEDDLRDRGVLPGRSTIFTHELEVLLRLTGGTDRMRASREHWDAFSLANTWVPAWRYAPDVGDPDDAREFIDAVERVVSWVENNV